jgi:hypothetical protein
MKRTILIITLFLIACGPIQPKVVDQYPTMFPTPTLAVNSKPIGDEDKEQAFDFFYELKNNMALSQSR